MKKPRHTPEQVIEKLRQADVLLGKRAGVDHACARLADEAIARGRYAVGLIGGQSVAALPTICVGRSPTGWPTRACLSVTSRR